MTASDDFFNALTSYRSNADFSEPGNSAKAAAFVTAVRILLSFPEQMTHGEESYRLNHSELRKQMEKAEKIQRTSTSAAANSQMGQFIYCDE